VNVARPPDGFEIRLEPRAQAALDGVAGRYPRIHSIWHGICQRMKMTGHREGRLLPGGNELVMEFPADAPYGIPKIAACFHVLGDRLTVTSILVVV
jgi:hypothetical protein